MKYLGTYFSLAAFVVLLIFFIIDSTSNGILYFAAFLLVCAIVAPCIANWIQNKK